MVRRVPNQMLTCNGGYTDFGVYHNYVELRVTGKPQLDVTQAKLMRRWLKKAIAELERRNALPYYQSMK